MNRLLPGLLILVPLIAHAETPVQDLVATFQQARASDPTWAAAQNANAAAQVRTTAAEIPPLTPYFVMRVGRLPMLPYFAPGDVALGPVAERSAAEHQALLLANHGPIAAGVNLAAATDSIEEIEETAALYLLLRGETTRPLDADQLRFLNERRRDG